MAAAEGQAARQHVQWHTVLSCSLACQHQPSALTFWPCPLMSTQALLGLVQTPHLHGCLCHRWDEGSLLACNVDAITVLPAAAGHCRAGGYGTAGLHRMHSCSERKHAQNTGVTAGMLASRAVPNAVWPLARLSTST